MSRTVSLLLADLRSYFEALPEAERASVDRGAPHTVWTAGSAPHEEIAGAHDGRLDDQELLQEAYDRLGRIRFGTASFDQELCPGASPSSFACWFRDHASEVPAAWVAPPATGDRPFLPPWLIDDADTATSSDRELRRLIDTVVPQAQQAVLDRGLAPASPEGRAALALELQERIHRPRESGGLGLRYDYAADRSHWRPDAVQAFERGAGDCNALAYIHFAMAERAGLNPRFIRISGRRDSRGFIDEIFHVGTAVAANPAHPETLTPFDPSGRNTIDENWEWFPVTDVEMAALHLRNVALRNAPSGGEASTVLAEQEFLFGTAVDLTPNFEVMLDAAWFYRNRLPNEERADALTASARILNPTLHSIW
ncbi:MAG TPA: hypothetical protein VFX30_07120 [bacterium]|nr:hypothetical protein [bacterium]